MASKTVTVHLGSRTVRAAAWPAADGSGWHWSVTACRYVDSLLVATSEVAAATCELAMDEAIRAGSESAALWWPDASNPAA